MTDYEQAYRGLRAGVEALTLRLSFRCDRLRALLNQGWDEDVSAQADVLHGVLADLTGLLASSTLVTASEGAMECDGSGRCSASLHVHGCYADVDGSACDDPEDHTSTGVAASDGDRGLSEEEREDLCICPPKGHVPGNHVDYCHNHLYDIELLIAARTAQPDGFERVEWGVRHPQGIKECRSEKEAREAVAEFRRRPGRANWHQSTVVRRRVGPWEVVGDE